jgi:hydroxymethylbilane synthase
MSTLRIGTRGTALALKQTDIVIEAAKAGGADVGFEVVVIRSSGDDNAVPAWRTDAPGIFTTTLSRALIEARVDAVVHSLKDLPVEGDGTTSLVAILERGHPEDVLIDRLGRTLLELPDGTRVGTSSLRRRAQVLSRRPGLDVLDIRGSVPSRIEQVDRGVVDAIVIARAGVERLGLDHRVTQILPAAGWLPAPGQAALAIEVRAGDLEPSRCLAALDHAPTRIATTIERSVLSGLMAGCHAPVGAFSIEREPGTWAISAAVWNEDGSSSTCVDRASSIASEAAAREFGREVADELLMKGSYVS